MSSLTEQAPAPTYAVGDKVLIKGTGRWWGGRNFLAKVVDVREDGTVKIRYADGGFKRFSKTEFETLLSPYDADPNLSYGSQTFELDSENYDPELLKTPGSKKEQSLQTQLKEAVYRRDFKTALELQNQIDAERAAADAAKPADGAAGPAKEAAAVPASSAALTRPISTAEPTASAAVPASKPSSSSAAGGRPAETDVGTALSKAAKRALGGGLAGASAMALQVLLLMPLRTTMNYQYRYGASLKDAIKTLHSQGGLRRFYAGILPALAQGPLSRFGDTAANTGILALLNATPATADLPVAAKTLGASAAAAMFRILLMPIDTIKTTLQVEGANAMPALRNKFKAHGPSIFFHGALATWLATLAGHYPWFATFNYLDHRLPVPDDTLGKLGRNAFVGFCSSVVSDTVSNSVRVVKTYRQTSAEKVSYAQSVKNIVAADGLKGLFGRGLSTRLLANGTQGLMFSVLWKYFDEQISKRQNSKDSAAKSSH